MKTIHEVEEAGTTAGPTGPCERWHEKSRQELEAEMTSLREQLRAAHASMRRTHAQMEVQKQRTKQLVAAWKVRLEEGEEKSRKQKAILDQQMQKVVADLMFFEGALRKEQKDIKISLEEKDEMITSQKRTIDTLLAANVALTKGIRKLKRKFKESVQPSPDVTSEGHSNWSIQQEADALISQIFSNRNNNYNHLPPGEMVDQSFPEVFQEHPTVMVEVEPIAVEREEGGSNNGDDNGQSRVHSTDPHVFFCLTESKGENSPSLNVKTTTAPYPVMYVDDEEQENHSLPTPAVEDRDYQTRTNHNETNVENGDWFRNNGMRTHVEQQPQMFEISPSKSCPNLGLAAIAEETNFIPDRGRTRSESEDFLLDNDVCDVDDVDSDVFTASHNSVSSVFGLECSFTSSMGDRVYENLPADDNLLLRRQTAFDQPSIEWQDSGRQTTFDQTSIERQDSGKQTFDQASIERSDSGRQTTFDQPSIERPDSGRQTTFDQASIERLDSGKQTFDQSSIERQDSGRQTTFGQASIERPDSAGSGVHSVNEGNGELEVEPPGDSKWNQIRSPPRTSSFNLLRRIRRPRDLKKKKAARTNSDTSDTSKNPPPERQRKLTI